MGNHISINNLEASLLGVGLYTPAEAAAYTGIPAGQIRRWLFGYTSGGKQYAGLWQPQLEGETTQALGFHDLLEVRFVHAFRRHGVSLQAIRRASAHARELYNQPYPFTCKRFQTDGRSIFSTVLEETGDDTLLDLVKKQYTFKQVITPSLYRGIEYNNDTAQRWYPLSRNRRVVLDPARNFGKPILTETGMTVDAIVCAWHGEGQDVRRVAALYEVPVAEVEAAIQFEQRIAA